MDTQPCHPLRLNPQTPQSVIYGGIGRVWLNGAVLSVCPACYLWLYTPQGEGHDTLTHTPTRSPSLPWSTHTSTCAQILLTSSMQEKQIRHSCIHAEAALPSTCSWAWLLWNRHALKIRVYRRIGSLSRTEFKSICCQKTKGGMFVVLCD